MTSSRDIQRLVLEFAESVIAQSDSIGRGDARIGNEFAKRYIAAFQELRALGDIGRDGLVPLLRHAREDVRVTAAAFLLRHKNKEALDVLRAESAGDGLAAFEASQAIKRWEEGSWSLDPT